VRELLEDPVLALSPLEPGEQVIWSGGPGRLPSVMGTLNFGCAGCAFVLPAALAAIAAFAIVASIAGWSPRFGGPLDALVESILVTIPIVFVAAWLVLGLAARRARRYVVTNRRVAVVDPASAYTFRIDLEETDVRGRDLRFGIERPQVVAKGSVIWQVVRLFPVARLRDLDDAQGLLAEIQRTCARSVEGAEAVEDSLGSDDHGAPEDGLVEG
jgi:hypothetical protein